MYPGFDCDEISPASYPALTFSAVDMAYTESQTFTICIPITGTSDEKMARDRRYQVQYRELKKLHKRCGVKETHDA